METSLVDLVSRWSYLSSEGISQRQFLRSKQKWTRPEMLGKEELLRQKREVPLLIGLCSVSSSQFLCQIQTSCLVKIRLKRNFQFPVCFEFCPRRVKLIDTFIWIGPLTCKLALKWSKSVLKRSKMALKWSKMALKVV